MKAKRLNLSIIAIIAVFVISLFTAGSDLSAGNSIQGNETVTNSISSPDQVQQGTNGSLYATFRQGGILMWPILFLGILGLTIIMERIIFYYRNRVWKRDVLERYIDITVKSSDTKFREELENEIQDAVQIYANKAEKGLALLNGIGNLAPVIGFFGTVQGMIGAFASIAAATTVNAKVVAVGIQIALITTAGGLSVAVPALAFFYFFSHLIQTMFARMDEIIGEKIKHLPRYSDYESSKNRQA